MPIQHILYNGKDHYDALVEIADLTGMVPSWPQPQPPLYFSPPAAAAGNEPSKPKAPRGSRKGKGRGKAKAKPAPSKAQGKSHGTDEPREPKAEAAPAAAAAWAAAEDEDEEDDCNQPGLMEALQGIPVAESSLHPQRQVEDLIKDIRCFGAYRLPYPLFI